MSVLNVKVSYNWKTNAPFGASPIHIKSSKQGLNHFKLLHHISAKTFLANFQLRVNKIQKFLDVVICITLR